MEREHELAIRTSSGADEEVLALTGLINVMDAESLHAAALRVADTGRGVVVCCEGLEYLDASAVQVLAALGRELRLQGRGFRVAAAGEAVQAYLRRGGLDSLVATAAAAAVGRVAEADENPEPGAEAAAERDP